MTPTTGMVLGKFMPPHAGHMYLVDFARAYVDDLTVVVGTLPGEPIDGRLRFAWMQELAAGARVVHLPDELPQHPREHPRFWDLWRAALDGVLEVRPDMVFASEDYGARLAEVLGADFVAVDPGRVAMPVSGTAVRADPFAHWRYLPPCVRAHYARRVCVFGPESTGKTTLAEALARALDTVWVPEYARTLIEQNAGEIDYADIDRIARGHRAAEDALARRANRVLVSDTDLLATAIWSDVLFGRVPPGLYETAISRRADLYLLCDVDVPWQADVARYLPDQRRSFFDRCKRELERHGCRYVEVRGTRDERLGRAVDAVRALDLSE